MKETINLNTIWDTGEFKTIEEFKIDGLVFKFPKNLAFECKQCGLCCERLRYTGKKIKECPYLRENLCSIYPKRYLFCKFYPYIIDRDKIKYHFLVLPDGRYCKGFYRGKPNIKELEEIAQLIKERIKRNEWLPEELPPTK